MTAEAPGRVASASVSVSEGRPTLSLTAAVERDGDWWVARCLDVEVASQGHSLEDALAALKEALELYFEDQPPPTGGHPFVTAIEVTLPA